MTHEGPRLCSVEGCEKAHVAKGFCRNHYYKKHYNVINKDHVQERQRSYDQMHKKTLESRYSNAKAAAKKRGLDFTLTKEEYAAAIDAPCFYCNNYLGTKTLVATGLDRLDNSFGYVPGNVQSCCKFCNGIKSDVLTVEETKAAIQAIIAVRLSKEVA